MNAIQPERDEMLDCSIGILTWGLAGGSLANYTAALMQGFWDLGLRNLYVLYVAEGPGDNLRLPPGVNLVPLGSGRARWLPVNLARRLRELKLDVLISISSFISLPAILGWVLAGKSGTQLIVSQHSTMSYKAYVEHGSDVRVRLQPMLARWLYPLASGLHANSADVLDDLLSTIGIRMPPERAFFTPNPVQLDEIAALGQQEHSHPWLRDKHRPVVLSVGRLARQKNVPLLLEVFARVRERVDARLVILGEGPERETIERHVERLHLGDVVSLPGFDANPWSAMARADVFVLASEEEPFGLVLVEAMACGLPVVACDAIGGGPKTVLENGQHGALVPRDDVEALASAILALLNSPDKHQHAVRVGGDRARAFQPEAIAAQWLDFLHVRLRQ